MPSSFDARSCGPAAWKAWLRTTGTLLRRFPLSGWLAVVGVVLSVEGLFSVLPSVGLGLVCALVLVARGPLGAIAQALIDGQRLGVIELVGLARLGWNPSSTWVFLGALLVAGVAESFAPVIPPGPSLFAGWVVGWAMLSLRPWGPLGFVNDLVEQGCPPLQAFALQSSGFYKNLFSFLVLFIMWILVLPGLVVLHLLDVPMAFGLFVPLTVAWLFLVRCIYLDVFGGGVSLKAQAPVSMLSARAALG